MIENSSCWILCVLSVLSIVRRVHTSFDSHVPYVEDWWTLKMKAVWLIETSVIIYQSARCNIPEDFNPFHFPLNKETFLNLHSHHALHFEIAWYSCTSAPELYHCHVGYWLKHHVRLLHFIQVQSRFLAREEQYLSHVAHWCYLNLKKIYVYIGNVLICNQLDAQ
jgi:hypothetical protein